MKRKSMFAALSLAALATAFVSCKKDEEKVEPVAPVTVKSTIKGKIMVNTNLRNDTAGISKAAETFDTPASGLAVTAQIDTRDWVYNAVPNGGTNGFEYEKKTYTATTSATGEFSIDVDVIDKGGNVELYFSDYSALQLTADSVNTTKVFSEPMKNVTALPGQTKFYNIELN